MDKKGQPNDFGPTPGETIEAVAKTIFRQAKEYGFSHTDFIRFVNIILDLDFNKKETYTPPPSQISVGENSEEHFSISSSRLAIQRYRPEHFDYLQRWVRDPEGRKFLLTRTSATEPDNLEELLDARESVFGIVYHQEKPIGAVAFLNIDVYHRKAELRKLIADPSTRGQGFAKEATRSWIDYGIRELKLRKIYLHTLDTNLANIRINEQLGFRVEGLLREECFYDGKFHDLLRMGLLVENEYGLEND